MKIAIIISITLIIITAIICYTYYKLHQSSEVQLDIQRIKLDIQRIKLDIQELKTDIEILTRNVLKANKQ